MAAAALKRHLVCLGECMIELSRVPGSDHWRMGFAGDTANVAIYCVRAGADVSYLSALGTDPYSAAMRAFLEAEGVRCDLILTHQGRVPGLYAISTDERGERSFTYWRDKSAARALFAIDGAQAALAQAAEAGMLYLSGITLSLFGADDRHRIVDLARMVRQRGGHVAFDGNYRPRGWADAETARAAFAQIAPHCSIVLPTFEDEVALFGDTRPEDCIDRWHGFGAATVVVKRGTNDALLSVQGGPIVPVPCPQPRDARDTTGAGDSFNAAFLTALLQGQPPREAVLAGHRLAGEVVMHPGAIIPQEAMPR